MIIPVVITVFADKSFTFICKSPPASVLLKKAAGIATASAKPNQDKVGKVTRKQILEIIKIKKADLPSLASQFLKRACAILEKEEIDFDKKVVAAVITQHYPDWRRVLNELQRYSVTGKIDEGILANFSQESFKSLVGFMKAGDFPSVRKWVGENSDIDTDVLFKSLYDNAYELMSPSSI